MDKIRVLLVDDHALMSEGLRALLSYYDDVEVVGDARDGREAIAQVDRLEPDVVLMDVAMPGMNGIDATNAIMERHPKTRVLIVTQHEDRQYVVPLLQAGASGYIQKEEATGKLVQAIRQVMEGRVYFSEHVSERIMSQLVNSAASAGEASITELSNRELQVFELIGHGYSTKDIAGQLHLSRKTVETYREKIKGKLNIASGSQLVQRAVQWVLEENR